MNRSSPFSRSLRWIWQRTSTLVATLLIVLAFLLGLRIGGDPDRVATTQPSTPSLGEENPSASYTCSMHPQVRLPDPQAKCPICFMALIPVSAEADEEGPEPRITLSETGQRLAEVDTVPVGRFFPEARVRLYGKITYDQSLVARITAYFPGRLDRLFVDYVGVPVRNDDHLAEIYSPDLLSAFEELRQAKLSSQNDRDTSELLRSATRRTLEASRDKLRLFGLRPDQIQAVERGEMTGDRFTVFSPISGVVTHLAAVEGDYVETGSPIATVASLDRLWLEMEAYESQLPLLRWGQNVSFSLEALPGKTFEGRISFIEPMVDDFTRTASVRVSIDNRDGRLKPGMFARAEVRTLVSEDGAVVAEDHSGKWVSPMHPEIVKDEAGACDVCGMALVPAETFTLLEDPSKVAEEPLVVPRTAVLRTGSRAVAYVRVQGVKRPTFEGREVVLGPRAGEFYVVKSGLQEGEEVVTNGLFKIDSAMQIAAKRSMMLPPTDRVDPHRIADAHPRFRSSLEPIFAHYFSAQEALADDDLSRFLESTRGIVGHLEEVDPSGVVGRPLTTWRRARRSLELETTPSTLDEARIAFEAMANGALELERQFGHDTPDTWYLVHCPMAFDFKGASWLQRKETIDNPYFGEAMLLCGAIQSEFPSQTPPPPHPDLEPVNESQATSEEEAGRE